MISYGNTLIGASAYDPVTGIALFGLPAQAPPLRAGNRQLVAAASDYQEGKNLNTTGADIMPNTAFANGTLRVVNRPAVTWLVPDQRACAAARTDLVVLAGSTARVRSVRFFDGRRLVATDRTGPADLFTGSWRIRGAKKGAHTLRAVVTDSRGRSAETRRAVRVCR